jgi:hypothetical protein
MKETQFTKAESDSFDTLFSRQPYNAELGQLQWLKMNRASEFPLNAPWSAITAGMYHWYEQGKTDLVKKALEAYYPDDLSLDRKLLEIFLEGTNSGNADELSAVLVTNIANLDDAEVMGRQELALKQMDRLAAQFENLKLLNTFVAQEGGSREGWEHRALPRTAKDILGDDVPPIPVFKDVLDGASDYAKELGLSYIVYANSDIIVSPEMLRFIKVVNESGFNCQGYARTDIRFSDYSKKESWVGLHLAGTDLFVLSVDWWVENRDIFEDYIMGAYWWDCVLVGQMMIHGKLFYGSHIRGLIFHQLHETISRSESKQAKYNLRLRDEYDIGYYDMFSRYCDRVRDFIKVNRSLPTIAVNEKLMDDKMTRFLKQSLSKG